jgi:hypothetical protein
MNKRYLSKFGRLCNIENRCLMRIPAARFENE